MDGRRVVEVSYSNGRIYKQTCVSNDDVESIRPDGCETTYHKSSSKFLDPLFPFFSVKKYKDGSKKMKYYKPSSNLYKLIEGDDTIKGEDLSIYDLSNDVESWVGIGKYKGIDDDYDIVFSVENDDQLRKVAEYYSMPFPLPKDVKIADNYKDWHSFELGIAFRSNGYDVTEDIYKLVNDFKLGSIKFKNNIPVQLKMYKSNFKDKKYVK